MFFAKEQIAVSYIHRMARDNERERILIIRDYNTQFWSNFGYINELKKLNNRAMIFFE